MSRPKWKSCGRCKVQKSAEAFRADKRRSDGLRSWCDECEREYLGAWRHEHREKLRRGYRKNYEKYRERKLAERRQRRTGVTAEMYAAALDRQDGRCAICNRHQSEERLSLAADHDHATGGFRGLLCGECNLGLGKFKDNPLLLERAIAYLRDNDPREVANAQARVA